MDRRHFLKTAAALSVGALLPKGMGATQAAEPAPAAPRRDGVRNAVDGMVYRSMGKSGVMVSPLGFGMMRLPSELMSNEKYL